MSEARIYVNGQEACFWPYGYNSFHFDVTSLLNKDGKNNILAVRLENKPQSSRWYSGAGLYRNVHVIATDPIHIPVWGTQISTPHVSDTLASVCLKTKVAGTGEKSVRLLTEIFSPEGKVVVRKDNSGKINHNLPFEQNFNIESPKLWSPESPSLYKAVTKVFVDGTQVDEQTTRFGIRSIAIIADKGFFLNGKHRKFQGVCNHHDLGPLGAAINVAALKHQLVLLKDMGCDAIRTSHNMPAPELVELCDEMGFMMMIEPFDEWDIAKCENGYHRFFKDWAEKDMVNMLHHYRNNPSVVMWSVGNEVPTQCSPEGYKVADFLQDICHREDPTRPVTCGMDQVSCVLDNGFAAKIDVPGFNYRVNRYEEAYNRLPQNIVLGSETASTVSSRGVYKLPAQIKADAKYDDHQASSYDLEYCSWSNLPDLDFAMADDKTWTIGQFVWTGFDYLGEPSPYDTDAWPSHSSLFGIIDLASIPKDRFYLYRSIWNINDATLHVLPHWNWEGHEGQKVPVFVYTSYDSAELFVNGKSYGKRSRSNETLQHRYRLMWPDVIYQPGDLKIVAFDKTGKVTDEKILRTAGKAHHLELVADRSQLKADGKDLSYITVRVVDKDGNLCPNDGRLVSFSVTGTGIYRAGANGDPTCLDLFHLPEMHAFSGQLTAIVQTKANPGEIVLEANAKGLKSGKIILKTE
jgi:beta-galactosidase